MKFFLSLEIFISLMTILSSKNTSEEIINIPIFSQESGFYDFEFELILSSKDNSPIFFTIDGSDPIHSNTTEKYNKPILIKDRTLEPNIYSEHQGEVNSSVSITKNSWYRKPQYLLDKAMVVRAVIQTSEGFGKVIDKTYFITNNKDKNINTLSQYKKYTIVSLVTNSENLFDADKGIYVVGNQYIEWRNSDSFDPKLRSWDPGFMCNYCSKGKEWEREATISIFEKGDLLLEQKGGIRMKGHATRDNAQKSFTFYARKEYGSPSFHSKLFADNYDLNGNLVEDYESFSLRSLSDESRLRDEMAFNIIRGREGLLTNIHTKIAILFLNGEYWGVYFLMEKISANSYSTHYNIPQEDLVVFKENEIEDGTQEDLDEYKNFDKEYIEKDLTDEKNYLEVCKNFDIDSMIEHYVTGIFLGTSDWPNRNFGMWKSKGKKIEGNPYSDGKWRFVSFDFDYSMGRSSVGYSGYESFAYDSFRYLAIRLQKHPGAPTDLFLTLIKNEEFRNKFINVFCDFVNEVAKSEKMNLIIEDFKRNYSDFLAQSQIRWTGQNETTKNNSYMRFKSNYENRTLSEMKTFFQERGHYTLGHMKRYFNLKSELHEITIVIKGNGLVKINSIIPEVKNGVWKGKYFGNIPINIKAISTEGTKFINWKGDINSNESSIMINLSEDKTIQAYFEQ